MKSSLHEGVVNTTLKYVVLTAFTKKASSNSKDLNNSLTVANTSVPGEGT